MTNISIHKNKTIKNIDKEINEIKTTQHNLDLLINSKQIHNKADFKATISKIPLDNTSNLEEMKNQFSKILKEKQENGIINSQDIIEINEIFNERLFYINAFIDIRCHVDPFILFRQAVPINNLQENLEELELKKKYYYRLLRKN